MKPVSVTININGEITNENLEEILHSVAREAYKSRNSPFSRTIGTATVRINEYPALRHIGDISAEELENDHSGVLAYNHLTRQGWEEKPVITVFGREYLLLYQPNIHGGRQTAEVLDITEFDQGENFKIARSGGYGYVDYEDESWAVLAVYRKTGKLTDYANPATAVLTYRVEKPTRDDVSQTIDEMDDELQNNIDNGGQLRM